MKWIYISKDGKQYVLKGSTNKNLLGKFKIAYMDYRGGCITYRKPGVENPWLPEKEAWENIDRVAALMGWRREMAL